MATLFRQVADNAISTTATNLTVAGVTSLTTATGDGAKFPLPGNGFRLDIWSGTSSDPTSDTNYEQVTVTARSGDVFTHTATTKSHSGTVNIMLPQDAADISDLTTAVNNLENGINNASVVGNEQPVGLVNGSNTAFTTASNMATGSLKVFRNGIRLKGGGVDFTQGSGNAFTFVTAPNTGDTLLVDYNVSATGFSVGTNSSTTNEQPTGTVNGTTTVFTTLRPYIASSLQVYIDGIMQRRGTDYTETTPSTGSFTMSAAPLTGQSILVDYQFNLNPSSNADTVDGIHASSTATANQLYPLDGNAKFGTDIQYDASDRIADHVVSGGVVALSSGLIGTFSDIVYYIGGKRYTATGIANHTYTASNDCYVDIDTTGTVTYTTGANNFASPTLAANSIRIAVVVTNGSTISYVHQGKIEFGVVSTGASAGKLAFSDGKGYPIYPTQAVQKIVAGLVRNSASTTGQPGATSAAYNGIANLPFQAKANTNYKLKFYEPVVSGMTANGVWVIEFYLSASAGAYTTRVDEFSALMLNTTAATGIYVEVPFNSGSYSGLTYLEFKLRTSGTTGTATMNGDTSTRMGRFYIETA